MLNSLAMETLIPAARELWRSPEFQNLLQIFTFLGSINAGFWILARVMGAFVDVFSELFWEEIWSALAIVYNIALAVFFSAVLFVSATKGAPPKDLMWREMCGFVMLYIALGASYMDRDTQRLDEHARPGYALGLIGYIVFAAFPKVVAYPELVTLIQLIKAVADSWIGKGLTLFMVVGIIWGLATRGLRGLFNTLSPFLWFIGVLKHPPIRIRREE